MASVYEKFMIIYLNGTSSSGKSSIAHELQNLIKKPIFYFSIDTLLYTLPPQILESIKGNAESLIPLNWSAIFQGYFDCVKALQNAGNFVIADCPVYSEILFQLFNSVLAPIKDKFVVGLDCSVDVLKAREKKRGDRIEGLAERQLPTIHSFLCYDLKVDSSVSNPKELANFILAKISAGH